MQLDSLIIHTRLRSGWSAIDLGFSLARRFWLRGLLLYLMMALPVLALTRLVVDWGYFLPYLILWWMKPVFERPILYMMSRELFAEPMSVQRVVADFWTWIKPSLFWVVTLRRLSTSRGMYAPISLLERPSGKHYRDRANVLGGKYSTPAFWLTVVLFHVESFFGLSVLVVFEIMAPDMMELTGWLMGDGGNSIYIDAISVAVMAVVAPFYVTAGFMLYISRRVELEGWDIEIIFRNWMANRNSEPDRTAVVSKSVREPGNSEI